MESQVVLSVREALGVATLTVSIVLNIFQFYRSRLYRRTIYNGLVGAFNSIGWILARYMNRTSNLSAQLAEARSNDQSKVIINESRLYSEETEFMLRQLHEQLVAMAKTLQSRDQRWQAGEFGYTKEEIERIRKALTERNQS